MAYLMVAYFSHTYLLTILSINYVLTESLSYLLT